ncbi:uncharacterized protein PRCAT00001797001 [Priceomyces carsonii]|uniref:uncharacterized protein n=1 Tax=Priceomyces carsonii TaxID=28549 RepID=UPI002ED82D60|nr:unnamed protein product [Priceomyces carsonii]
MYADLANKLIRDAKRTSRLNEVPAYQSDLVKDILKEIADLNVDASYLADYLEMQENEGDYNEESQKINQCQLFVTHLSMRRNKRCLLAYERLRAEKIDEFAWLNIDPIEPNNEKKNKLLIKEPDAFGIYTYQLLLENLNPAEQEYFKNYQDLLLHYKTHFSDIDLSGNLEPPKNIFTDVRVLKDGGEIQTEYGVFNLIKDSQFYVRKSDVERLIQQGYLEEL